MESISSVIVAAASLLGAIVAALLGGLTVWAFRDIRSRTRDVLAQILATIMVGVIPIAGILVYLMLRPRETLSEKYVRALEEESLLASIENQEFCPTCSRRVEHDMQWCPSCHGKLRNACGSCGRAVHLSWELCPYCGNGLKPELPNVSVKMSEPHRAPSLPASQPKPLPKVEPARPPVAQPLSQARANAGAMLDKVGGALGSIADRVQTRMQTQNGDRADESSVETKPPTEPELPTHTNGANGNNAPKKLRPLISREDEEGLKE
jgi:RNA polymerase subunit RPABC4/transcription elongation factor Spt4